MADTIFGTPLILALICLSAFVLVVLTIRGATFIDGQSADDADARHGREQADR